MVQRLRIQVLAVLFLSSILTGGASVSADEVADNGSDEIQALKKENAQLRATCKALEERIALLEKKQAVRDSVSAPAPTIKKADSGTTTVAKPEQRLDLNGFLVQMDGFVEQYNRAETSVLKGDVSKAMLSKADALVKDKTLSDIMAKIKDVQIGADGLVAVSLSDVRLADLDKLEYRQRGQPRLSVSFMSSTATVKLRMPSDAARRLKVGQQVRLSGSPSFVGQNWGAPSSGALTVLHFVRKGAQPWDGGAIVMRLAECKTDTEAYSVP